MQIFMSFAERGTVFFLIVTQMFGCIIFQKIVILFSFLTQSYTSVNKPTPFPSTTTTFLTRGSPSSSLGPTTPLSPHVSYISTEKKPKFSTKWNIVGGTIWQLRKAFSAGEVSFLVIDEGFLFYFILFYFILFYFILFYFILFYFILFYFILFYSILLI